MNSMTLTPGAGDYLAVFSTSVENDTASAFQRVSIFVNSVQQAHTEREFFNEESLPGTEYPLATAAHITVGAGEAVEVRWLTTAGTSTARARTLNLYPVASADVSQATATADATTTSATDVLLDNMTYTPGAGDYVAIFSTSGVGPSGAVLAFSIYVGGTKVAHTERAYTMEPSIPNTEFVPFIAAKVSPTAGQAVEVKWSRQAGSGTITAHERTLTLYKTDASNIFEAPATADTSSTSTTDVLMESMTLTPGAGDYLALFSSSLGLGTVGSTLSPYHSIYVNEVKTAHTERIAGWDASIDLADLAIMTNGVVSPSAGQAVEVRWRASAADSRTARERTFLLLKSPPATASTTGTATATINEGAIVAGGKTVILTLTNDTYVPATSERVTPVIEAADATNSGNDTASGSWAVDRPTLATGDMLIMFLGWDDGTTTTGVTVANGPNGEVWQQINSVVASASTEVRMTAYYVIATGAWGAGTITVTPSASEQWTATVVKVPAGEFDASVPIGASATRASAAIDETSVLMPAFDAGSTDGVGRLIWAGTVDNDPQTTLAGGYTQVANVDRGNESLSVQTRDAAVTNSESLSGGTRAIGSDSWVSLGFIVRAPATPTPFADARAAMRDGGDSAQSESGGWDAKVKPNIPLGNIVRTSDTVVTITLQAQADYDISAQETITWTIPSSILTGANPIVATPTFTIDAAAGGSTLTQNDFEFWVDNDALTPVAIWGNPDIAENTALNALPPSNDPIDPADEIRIRMNISVTAATLAASSEDFILQYKEAQDCTDGAAWTDVDAAAGAGTWRFAASGVTDNSTLTTLLVSTSDVAGRYNRSDPTTTNPNAVTAGQEFEWDWHVEYNGTAAAKTYCFRMVKSPVAALDAYNADSYPRVDIRPGTADLMRHGNFFTTGTERGFFWAN
ncbi:TPA: hypothetical protein DIS56_00170 [Candidatus Saccharibacteria bacterium]|nr:hypothetical protein [Candidatus Saccharibacteria bacterium]